MSRMPWRRRRRERLDAGGAVDEPDEYAKMSDSGVVQWNEQGVHRVLNPPDPAAYRAAPRGDIYVEYDVPSDVLSPHSAGSSIIYGPDSTVAKNIPRSHARRRRGPRPPYDIAVYARPPIACP